VKEADYTGIPSILFSHPVLTRAGLLEQECLDQGIDYRLKQADASTWSSYQRLGEQTAAVKVLYQPQSRQILGAHLLGRRFEETINVFAQAIQEGLTLDSIGQKVWAYPSFTYEVVHEALLRS
jgi:glutathione reductase (NADPH)